MATFARIMTIAIAVTSAGCAASETPISPHRVDIRVAPLQLPGIDFACYDILVQNQDMDPVIRRGNPAANLLSPSSPDTDTLCSTRFGNGPGGDISYVAPCDAQRPNHTVTVWVDGLYTGTPASPVAVVHQDPCPTGCALPVVCAENADTPVTFNLTVMRPANQGFFDVAVNFRDIFCSAKLDCTHDGDPIELLFHPTSQERDQTVVLGFACTAGAGDATETVLFRDAIEIDCGGVITLLDPTIPEGNAWSLANPDPNTNDAVWQYASYFGEEALSCGNGSCNKRFWNIAIGFDTSVANCTLRTRMTAASANDMPDFTTPENATYPWIEVNVPLTGAADVLLCSEHPLNGTPTGVGTEYTLVNAHRTFCHRLDSSMGSFCSGMSQCLPGGDCQCAIGYLSPECVACAEPEYTDPDGDGVCERRGEVALGDAPSTAGFVGVPWAYTATASQAGFMPGDSFTFSLESAPPTMSINGSTGVINWTPTLAELTWNADPLLEVPHPLVIRVTAPDGQFADYVGTVRVLPEVTYDGLHPAAGRAGGGEIVTVSGSGFLTAEGLITVRFGDLDAAAITVVDDATLRVTTPTAIAMTRPVRIEIGGPATTFEERPGFTHLPFITAQSADSTTLNSTITLDIEGLDPNEIDANGAAFASRDRSERVIAGTGLPTGNTLGLSLGVGNADPTFASGSFTAMVNGLRGNYKPLTISDATVTAVLAVTSFDGPKVPGETMRLFGAGFGGLTTTSLQVAFSSESGTVAGTVTSVTGGTEVAVTVPAGAVSGPVILSATGRLTMRSRVPVEISGTTPVLWVADVTPEIVTAGDALIITGSGFLDREPTAHAVTIGGLSARVVSAEPGRLVVEVPAGVTLGPAMVSVTVNGVTDATFVIGIGTTWTHVAGGGTGLPVPLSTSPTGVPVVSDVVLDDPSGLMILFDGVRIRAWNRTAAPVVAYGVTIAPGAASALVEADARGVAISPIDGDMYYGVGHRIFRMSRTTGASVVYSGQVTAGNSGNGGHRLSASYAAVYELAFTSTGLLVVADYNNGNYRAINTTASTQTMWGITFEADQVQHVERTNVQSTVGLAVTTDNSLYVASVTNIYYIPWDRKPSGDPEYVRREDILGNGSQTADPQLGCPVAGKPVGLINYLAVDPNSGDLYVGSRKAVVRRIVAAGGNVDNRVDGADCIDSYAGIPLGADLVAQPGTSGDGGPAVEARIALTPRPYVGADGALLIAGNGFIRRVANATDAANRIVTTIAGAMPLSLSGVNAFELDTTLGSGSKILVDEVNERIFYTYGLLYVLAHDLADDIVTVVAGTGLEGNTLGGPGGALQSDFSRIRGIAFWGGGDRIAILEAVAPRVSSLDIASATVTVLAGTGTTATVTEQQTAGVAVLSKVAVTTGTPKVVEGPDGLLWFADGDYVRMVNPTNGPITSFGKTIPAGGIDWLFGITGFSTSSVAFDPAGNLYAAGRQVNRLVRVRPSAPSVIETVIPFNSARMGRMRGASVSTLRVGGVNDLAFLENGDMVISPVGTNSLVYIKANPDGSIDNNCLTAPVFGAGAPGGMLPGRAAGAQTFTLVDFGIGLGRVFGRTSRGVVALDLPD